jgi:anaerobic selenocysteine-containing dehydrogenase
VHTCGFTILADPDYGNSKCIVIWGKDVEASYRGTFYDSIQKALKQGAKLIVVDPRKIGLVKRADAWLQVRPGTDCALALGMIHVIIKEKLYDKEFVEKWTVGFDQLAKHVEDYPPEKVADITWVPANKIVEASRMIAQNSPTAIGVGTGGLDQNTNSFQTGRAIAILASITGNLDIPGGSIEHGLVLKDKSTMASIYDAPYRKLSPEQIQKRLSYGKIIKNDGLMLAHPKLVWRAINEGEPYPVKSMLGVGQNLIVASENSQLVRSTLLKLDFFACFDLFMTPTTEVADLVLPVAHWSERDEVIDAYTKNYIFCHKKVVEPPEHCWEDKKILVEIAKRLGLTGYWKSVEECLDDRMARTGITFDEFRKKGMLEGQVTFKKYEKHGSFKTPSKKVELYAEHLEKIGVDPLPVFKEPPESPVSTPELAKKYPLILVTGIKTIGYLHSAFRSISQLRKLVPEPILEIHPNAAKQRHINDGDWVSIETLRGKILHKARFDESLNPAVVTAQHGWWYGYKDGWKTVNINMLTDDENIDPNVGSGALKGLMCEVRKSGSPVSEN